MRPLLGQRADVAQLVEQLTRNEQVSGSSPLVGSNFPFRVRAFATRLREERRRGQAVGAAGVPFGAVIASAKPALSVGMKCP